MLLLLLACTVNPAGPATPGSPAAELLPAVDRVAAQAAEIEALATELESLSDPARGVPAGPERDEAIAKMRAVMAQIEEKNAALQAEIEALEEGLHEAAGDPAWPPPEPEER